MRRSLADRTNILVLASSSAPAAKAAGAPIREVPPSPDSEPSANLLLDGSPGLHACLSSFTAARERLEHQTSLAGATVTVAARRLLVGCDCPLSVMDANVADSLTAELAAMQAENLQMRLAIRRLTTEAAALATQVQALLAVEAAPSPVPSSHTSSAPSPSGCGITVAAAAASTPGVLPLTLQSARAAVPLGIAHGSSVSSSSSAVHEPEKQQTPKSSEEHVRAQSPAVGTHPAAAAADELHEWHCFNLYDKLWGQQCTMM